MSSRRIKLKDENVGRWEVKRVLYVDEAVLLPKTGEHLQYTVL